MEICPKLRTFKLFVTASLPDLGATLGTLGHCLDQVRLTVQGGYTHREKNRERGQKETRKM